jgi:hypothetical protein
MNINQIKVDGGMEWNKKQISKERLENGLQ